MRTKQRWNGSVHSSEPGVQGTNVPMRRLRTALRRATETGNGAETAPAVRTAPVIPVSDEFAHAM